MTIQELYEKVGGDYEDVIRRLQKENLIDRFVRMYESGSKIEILVSAYQEQDYAKVFDISHDLKGMSANLSFHRMNQTMTEICEAVRHGVPQMDISGLVEEARVQHEQLSEYVKELE